MWPEASEIVLPAQFLPDAEALLFLLAPLVACGGDAPVRVAVAADFRSDSGGDGRGGNDRDTEERDEAE